MKNLPEEPANRSRELLLMAASELMIERRSVDISLSEIAQRARLNSALVKYYFGNKNSMMVALLEEVLRGPQAQMEAMLEFAISPVEKLRLHIKGIIRTYFRFPYANRLIHAVSQNKETAAIVAQTVTRPLVAAQAKLLKEGIESGHFRKIDVMLFYFIIVGACDHLFFEQNILNCAFGIERVTPALRADLENTLLDLVLRGLLKDPTRIDKSDVPTGPS